MKCLLFLLATTTVNCNPFKTIFAWKQMDWEFPSDEMRSDYIKLGKYVPADIAPLGINVWNDKVFITVPRWRKGVPANLNYISLSEAAAAQDTSPLLKPYPNWESNDINSPDSIVNVLRVRIDACDRLWAVDSGVDDIFSKFESVQPKKLIAIDLNTNEIIMRYTFKDSDVKSNSLFAETVIDVDPKNCDNAYVYNSDVFGSGLVVYSLAKNDSWRIDHNYFHFDPLNGDYNINGNTFQWTDGVIGLALTPTKEDGSKTLYFHSMSGIHEFSVSTSLLKNQTALADANFWKEFHVVGNKGPKTQGTSLMLDTVTGIIYFTQLNKNAVACWDTEKELNSDNFKIVAQNNETFVFANDIVIEPKTRMFYFLSDNLAALMFSKNKPDEINFYIHAATMDDLTAVCRAKIERT